jgi:hypothetical protein
MCDFSLGHCICVGNNKSSSVLLIHRSVQSELTDQESVQPTENRGDSDPGAGFDHHMEGDTHHEGPGNACTLTYFAETCI